MLISTSGSRGAWGMILGAAFIAGGAGASEEPFAWILTDPGVRSSRLVPVIELDGATEEHLADQLRRVPEGRRALLSRTLLTRLTEAPADRVAVRGRLTDYPGPWLEDGVAKVRRDLDRLAAVVASRRTGLDVILVDEVNPLRAEKLDDASDLVWMAIRNDRRFADLAAEGLTLRGAMTPASPQWERWNALVEARVDAAIAESSKELVKGRKGVAVLRRPDEEGKTTSFGGASALRLYGQAPPTSFEASGFAPSSFMALAEEVSTAAALAAEGRRVVPWILPYSVATSEGERSAIAGTITWDEMVRHAALIAPAGIVCVERRRGSEVEEDARRLAAVLDEVARQSAGASLEVRRVEVRRGATYLAVGASIAPEEVLWRISLAPGVNQLDAELDGEPRRLERDRGAIGTWLRQKSSQRLAFFEVADDDFAPRDGSPSADVVTGKEGERTQDGTIATVPTGEDLGFTAPGGQAEDAYLGGGTGQGAWSDAGWQDLNGDGRIDGIDLTMDLAAREANNWTNSGIEDLNGDGRVDGIDLTIELAGAPGGRPKTTDGTVAIELSPDVTGVLPNEFESGSTSNSTEGEGSVPPVDPTTPVTPPTAPPPPPAPPEVPSASPRPPLPIPLILSDSLLETAGASLYTVPTLTAEIMAEGAAPARVYYQQSDPTCGDGTIDPSHVASWVIEHWGSNPTGWFILDYEVPHFHNLAKGLADPNNADYIRTRDSFVAALQSLKLQFPNARWSVYGLPSLPAWFQVGGVAHTHVSIPDSQLQQIIAARRALVQAIVDECDFVSPTIYDRDDARNYPTPAAAEHSTHNARLRNERVVELSKAMIAASPRTDRPVTPFVNLWFAPGGSGGHFRLIPLDQVRSKQIQPAIAGGADSLIIWTAAGYYARLTTNADQPGNVEQQQVRAAFAQDILGSTPTTWQSDGVRQQLLADWATRVAQVQDVVAEERGASSGQP